MNEPVLSVVVATHNRSAYLRKALDSLRAQTLPADQFEVIVVNNGSTDDTEEVLAEYTASAPNFCAIYEPRLGASIARNTGSKHARGRYLVYLDSDAVASPEWLSGYLDAFEGFEPRPDLIGGRCDGIWEGPQPRWLSDRMLGALSILHWSDTPTVLESRQWLSVCNMGVRRELFERAGGFREDVGRKGTKLLANEEILLRKQLDSWGCVTLYHPELVVGHHVPASRLVKSWFRKRAYWQGWSDAVMFDDTLKPTPTKMLFSLKRLAWISPRAPLAALSPDESARFRRECQVLEIAGYLHGLWRP